MIPLRIGTRSSALARWQAEHIALQIKKIHPRVEVSFRFIKTTGDKILDVPLAKVGGKGLFVKEIEEALLRNEIDLAVHSIKDVPAEIPDGLILAAIPEREDPSDAFLFCTDAKLLHLKQGAKVGTSSLRRRCQLLHLRPDLQIHDLRGNVDTRIKKLHSGLFDGIVLANAGLKRLNCTTEEAEILSPNIFLPAVGQGALGIETRANDTLTQELLAPLHNETTAKCIRAERAFLLHINGGCQVPVAAYAYFAEGKFMLDALIGHPSGNPLFRAQLPGDPANPEAIGHHLAELLLNRGGKEILEDLFSG